jgi:hypothetical protein
MACAAGRPTSARLEPVHSLEGVRPLIHVVLHLPALLAGPGPSGGAGPSRRCRGCSWPPLRLQGQAAPSFTGLLRQAGGGLLQPTRLHGASRRTASSMQSAPASIEWTRVNSLRPGWAAPGRSPRSMSASAACSMPSRSASVAGSSRPALAMAWVSSTRCQAGPGCGRIASRKCPPDAGNGSSGKRHSPRSEGLSHNPRRLHSITATVDPGYRASPNEVTSPSTVDPLRRKGFACDVAVTPFSEAL